MCGAALYEGVAKEEESTEFEIDVVAFHEEFKPLSGENNDIKLSNKKSTVTKGFKLVVKTIEEECPNLK